MGSRGPQSTLTRLSPPPTQNLLSLQLLLMSSPQVGPGMLTLGGPLEPRALRAQGPPTLWVGWTLAKVPLPPQRKRPLGPQASPDWTARRRVTMTMRECPEA